MRWHCAAHASLLLDLLFMSSITGVKFLIILPYIFPCPDFRFGRRHTHRALRRGIMSAKAGSGISVMRSDLDASTSTEVDAHEAQWRAGVNRQARPDAASQRRAASLAAAAKRRRIRT